MSAGALRVDRRQLPNGLALLGHRNEASAAVVMRAMLRTGAIFDDPAKAGTARLTGAMLQRGTKRHTFEELNALTDREGVSISVDVGRQTTDVNVKCLLEDLDL